MKNKDLKKQLRNLQKTSINESSLVVIEKNLKEFINFYPSKSTKTPKNQNPREIGLKFSMQKVVTAFVIVALVLSGGRVVLASRDSLPGDILYPIKTLSEDIEKVFMFNDAKKADFEIKLAEKRIIEINAISNKDHFEEKNIRIAEKLLEKHLEKATEFSQNMTNDFKEKIKDNVENINNQKNSQKEKHPSPIPGIGENKKEAGEEILKNNNTSGNPSKNKPNDSEQKDVQPGSKPNITNNKDNDSQQQNNKKNGRKEV